LLSEVTLTDAGLGQFPCRYAVEFVVEDGAALQGEVAEGESYGQRGLRNEASRSRDSVPHVTPAGGDISAGEELCRGRRRSHGQSRET